MPSGHPLLKVRPFVLLFSTVFSPNDDSILIQNTRVGLIDRTEIISKSIFARVTRKLFSLNVRFAFRWHSVAVERLLHGQFQVSLRCAVIGSFVYGLADMMNIDTAPV